MVNMIAKVLVGIGSAASVGFGIWHFHVPRDWKWYSYMDPAATELPIAVSATNVFFSLSLVLFGLMNALLVLSGKANRFSMAVVLGAACILWLARVLLQLVRPQGSINPFLQYAMLSSFVAIFLCHAVALLSIAGKGKA